LAGHHIKHLLLFKVGFKIRTTCGERLLASWGLQMRINLFGV
jgi:hypothetical protein